MNAGMNDFDFASERSDFGMIGFRTRISTAYSNESRFVTEVRRRINLRRVEFDASEMRSLRTSPNV